MMDRADPLRLLILGGTTEAVRLAHHLAGSERVEATTSMAGRTVAHAPPPGRVRVGGFGGAAGLAAYLREARVEAVIDATHPFAATISRNAARACAETGTPRLMLRRPPWQAEACDRWIAAADVAEAAARVAALGRRVFLTVGRQELAAFAGRPEPWFLVRMIEPPADPLPLARCELILARGPFAEAGEADLLRRHGIDLLVTKNSGGAATWPKLAAARALGVPVLMIDRPPAPPGEMAESVDPALDWLDRLPGSLP